MYLESNSGMIEGFPTENIDSYLLDKLLDIQKDAWSSFAGEYVKCEGECKKTFSKENIYPKNNKKPIWELEKDFGKIIKCINCGGETKHLWGKGVNLNMEKHFFDSIDSYLVIIKDKIGKILGFSYAYVDTLENIFNKEFSDTFSFKFLDKYKDIKNEVMISIPCTCMEESYLNIYDVVNLFKGLMMQVDTKYIDYVGVFETVIGTLTYEFFQKMGGKVENLLQKNRELYIKDKDYINGSSKRTDIIFHPGIVKDYRLINKNFKEIMGGKK